MVKYKYIGKTTYLQGKTLWEIIGNLKDYGVGRLVYRHSLTHLPEPSFFKIIKSEAFPQTIVAPDNYRKCIVWVEEVDRGFRLPQIVELHRSTYKPDFHLIPKDEEHLWYKRVAETPKPTINIPPTHIEVPPLLKSILNEERKEKGQPVDEDMLAEAKLTHATKTMISQRVKDLPEKHVLRGFGRMEKTQSLYANIEAYKINFLNENKSE